MFQSFLRHDLQWIPKPHRIFGSPWAQINTDLPDLLAILQRPHILGDKATYEKPDLHSPKLTYPPKNGGFSSSESPNFQGENSHFQGTQLAGYNFREASSQGPWPQQPWPWPQDEMRLLNGLSSLVASSPGRRAPVWCEDVYHLSDLPLETGWCSKKKWRKKSQLPSQSLKMLGKKIGGEGILSLRCAGGRLWLRGDDTWIVLPEYSLEVQQLAPGPKTKNSSSNPNFLEAVSFKEGWCPEAKKDRPIVMASLGDTAEFGYKMQVPYPLCLLYSWFVVWWWLLLGIRVEFLGFSWFGWVRPWVLLCGA